MVCRNAYFAHLMAGKAVRKKTDRRNHRRDNLTFYFCHHIKNMEAEKCSLQ